MGVVDSIKADDGGNLTIETKNGRLSITEKQANDLKVQAAAALKAALERVSIRADGAMGRYAAQQKINVDSPVSAYAADLMARAKATISGGHYEDPGPKLYPLDATVTNSISAAKASAGAGKFSAAAASLGDAEAAMSKIEGMVQAYVDGLISAAESNVTVLEYTKSTCFLIDGAIAAVVTGGGSAALTSAVGATEVGGSAATVGLIANAAPIVASAASYGEQYAVGDPVDWKKATADILIQVVLAKFGGKLTEGVASQVGRAGIDNAYVKKIVAAEIIQAGSGALQTLAATVVSDCEGKHITWGQFMAAMEKAVLDPKGIVVAAAGAAVSAKYPAPQSGGSAPGKPGGQMPDETSQTGAQANSTPTDSPAATGNGAAAPPPAQEPANQADQSGGPATGKPGGQMPNETSQTGAQANSTPTDSPAPAGKAAAAPPPAQEPANQADQSGGPATVKPGGQVPAETSQTGAQANATPTDSPAATGNGAAAPPSAQESANQSGGPQLASADASTAPAADESTATPGDQPNTPDGKAGGGGPKPRNLVNKDKNAEHSYMTGKRVDRLAREAMAAEPNAPERNPSLLSKEFADPANSDMIKAAADAEIAQGNFQPDGKDGAMSVKLDFAPKQTGWSDGQPTTKLIVRIRKNGTWHCFPSP